MQAEKYRLCFFVTAVARNSDLPPALQIGRAAVKRVEIAWTGWVQRVRNKAGVLRREVSYKGLSEDKEMILIYRFLCQHYYLGFVW